MPTHASLSLFWCVQDYGDDIEIDGFDIDYGVSEFNLCSRFGR